MLFVALVIKIAAGTACLLDAPAAEGLASTNASVATHAMKTDVADATKVAMHEATTVAAGETVASESCLLGETGDCHCACAHAATLPATLPHFVATIALPDVVMHLPMTLAPRTDRSPLRPPIA